MALDRETVRKIAYLARIGLREEEFDRLVPELAKILHFVEQMNQLETSDVEPMAHPLDLPQRLRPDRVTEGDIRDKVFPLAPAVEASLYLVPKVIES